METTTAKQNKQELLFSFDEIISELIQLISSCDEQELNTIPFEGSWTAGQVGEHLLKSGFLINLILKGNTRTAERPIAENVKLLEDIFLDFSRKSKAAEGVRPSDAPKEKKSLVENVKAKMDEIRQVAEAKDLSVICTNFPFPSIGDLTRWEWINMIILHTKRHVYQLKNIRRTLSENKIPY